MRVKLFVWIKGSKKCRPYLWHDQEKWVTCQRFSILSFLTHPLVSWKCYVLVQTPLESDIELWAIYQDCKQYKTKESELFPSQYLKNNICDIQLFPLDHVTYLWAMVINIFSKFCNHFNDFLNFHSRPKTTTILDREGRYRCVHSVWYEAGRTIASSQTSIFLDNLVQK